MKSMKNSLGEWLTTARVVAVCHFGGEFDLYLILFRLVFHFDSVFYCCFLKMNSVSEVRFELSTPIRSSSTPVRFQRAEMSNDV